MGDEPVAESAAEPAEEPVSTEEPQESKKRDIVKKKKALAGKFVTGDEKSFSKKTKSKKHKETEETAEGDSGEAEAVEEPESVGVEEPVAAVEETAASEAAEE